MPICTSCTHPTPYLYTTYESAYNTRLEQCATCHVFADPYVEHDALTLLLDLILLKRDVFRHLLFNRGLGARRAGEIAGSASVAPATTTQADEPRKLPDAAERRCTSRRREKARWWLIVRLGAALIAVDAFIRWTHLGWTRAYQVSDENVAHLNTGAIEGFFRIFVGCFVETIAFHAGIMIACFVVLTCLHWVRSLSPTATANSEISGIHLEFRYSHVPLTLLYSSLTKLFLLFLLSVWRPASTNEPVQVREPSSLPVVSNLLLVLDEEHLDREWVVRNVLGGMAAGFGLRVVLDCHPIFTTTIILAGWAVKTLAAGLITSWVVNGLPETVNEVWLSYSIP